MKNILNQLKNMKPILIDPSSEEQQMEQQEYDDQYPFPRWPLHVFMSDDSDTPIIVENDDDDDELLS